MEEQLETLRDANARAAGATAVAKQNAAERDTALALGEEVERQLERDKVRYEKKLADLNASVQEDRKLLLAEHVLAAQLIERKLPAISDFDRPSVWTEVASHLRTFVGREVELDRLERRLRASNQGEHVLLLGTPGLGKSALISALFDRLTSSDTRGAGSERRRVPALLYMPKSGAHPRQILQFLLWQAANLLGPVLPLASYNANIADLRERLHGVLSTLVERDGSAWVLVDGLDEIVTDLRQPGRELAFIPDSLPPGVKWVLSTRPIRPIVQKLKRRITQLDVITLEALSRPECEAMVTARVTPEVARWAGEHVGWGRLFDRTGGVPLLVAHVAAAAASWCEHTSERDVPDTWIPASLEDVFADLLREIRELPRRKRQSGARVRQVIVELLALSPEPLGVQELQRGAGERKITITTAGIRSALEDLGAIVITLGPEIYALYHRGFAQFVASQIGADGRAATHRALAGTSQPTETDISARGRALMNHLWAWRDEAEANRNADGVRSAVGRIADALTAPRLLDVWIATGALPEVIEWLDRLCRASWDHMTPDRRTGAQQWRRFLVGFADVLYERPSRFRQIAAAGAAGGISDDIPRSWASKRLRRVARHACAEPTGRSRLFTPHCQVDSPIADALSASGGQDTRVIALVDDDRVIVWSVPIGRPLWRGIGALDGAIALSPSGRLAAAAWYQYEFPVDESGEEDEGALPTATIWSIDIRDGATGHYIGSLNSAFRSGVQKMIFSADERFLFAAIGEGERAAEYYTDPNPVAGRVVKIDLADFKVVAEFDAGTPCFDLALSPDGTLLAVGGGFDCSSDLGGVAAPSIRCVLRSDQLVESRRLEEAPEPCISVASVGGHKFVFASTDGTLAFAGGGDGVETFATNLSGVTTLKTLPGWDFILIGRRPEGSPNGEMWIASIESPHSPRRVPVAGNIGGFAPIGDGSRAVVGTERGVALIDLPAPGASGDEALTPSEPDSASLCEPLNAYSTDLRWRFQVLTDGGVTLSDALTDAELERWRGPMILWSSPDEKARLQPRRAHVAVGRQIIVASSTSFVGRDELTILQCGRAAVCLPLASVHAQVRAMSPDEVRVAVLVQPLSTQESKKIERNVQHLTGFLERLRPTEWREAVERRRSADGPASSGWNAIAKSLGEVTESSLAIVDVHNASMLHVFPLGPSTLTRLTVKFAPSGDYVAWRGLSNRLTVRQIADPLGEGYAVRGCSEEEGQAPAGTWSQSADGSGPIDDLEIELGRSATTFGWSADGRELWVAGSSAEQGRMVWRWEVADGSELTPLSLAVEGEFELLPDGRYLVEKGDRGVKVVDVRSGGEAGEWIVPGGLAAFAVRDEGRIALLDDEGTIEVLEVI